MSSITPHELRTQLDLGTEVVVIDVRSAVEFAWGHVPGAIHVPFWKLLSSAAPGGLPRSSPVVVYCGHGPRAQLAMMGLRMRGYSSVCDLLGHWQGWRRLGFPETRGSRP